MVDYFTDGVHDRRMLVYVAVLWTVSLNYFLILHFARCMNKLKGSSGLSGILH
jgi:hypothetical protein